MIISETLDDVRKKLVREPRPAVVKAFNDAFNRSVVEKTKIDVLCGAEGGKRKDTIKSLDSGINGVLARIAHKRNISFAADVGALKSLSPYEKARYLARMRYNLALCRKASARYLLVNVSREEERAILISLGASTTQIDKHNIFNAS